MKRWEFLIFFLWTLVTQAQSIDKRASERQTKEDTIILGNFGLHMRNKLGLFEQKLKNLAQKVKAVGRGVAHKIKLNTPTSKPPTGIVCRIKVIPCCVCIYTHKLFAAIWDL